VTKTATGKGAPGSSTPSLLPTTQTVTAALPKEHIWELSSEALQRGEVGGSARSWGGCHPHRSLLTPALDALSAEAAAALPRLLSPPHAHDSARGDDAGDAAGEALDFGILGGRVTAKVQANDGGGGCFPFHFDTAPGIGDGKRVTAIYYLNGGWAPGDGGELEVNAFPYGPTADSLVEPLGDRLVLFSSREILHRVLPSKVPRFCVTFWVYEAEAAAAAAEAGGKPPATRARPWARKPGRPFRPSPSTAGVAAGAVPAEAAAVAEAAVAEAVGLSLLLRPSARRHFARLALAPAWASSVAASHAGGEGEEGQALRACLATQASEVVAIEAALKGHLAGAGLRGDAADPLALARKHLPIAPDAHPGLVRWF
jgi:hypothetical protein